MDSLRRLYCITRHLQPRISSPLIVEETSANDYDLFNIEEMSKLIDPFGIEWRNQMFDIFRNDPLFKFDYNLTKEQFRDVTRRRFKRLVDAGLITVLGKHEDGEKYFGVAEAINYYDASLGTLIGVQHTLFASSIKMIGTEYHHTTFLKDADAYRMPGCFAMTELGHGSNARGIETIAVFDQSSDVFVINTPSESAQKYWIGGCAEAAVMSTVFAQLYINGEHYGVHAFLVPLRDSAMKTLPGIRIKDNGHKMGLNGIDNGRIWFENVRIPREYMLNKFGSVTRNGEYETGIPDNDMRFAATLGNLIKGRITIVSASINMTKIALATTIRYSFQRNQFGPSGEEEIPIMMYQIHQRRLFPLLATTYASIFSFQRLYAKYEKALDSGEFHDMKEVHMLASGLKALSSWHQIETLQICREACGGQGFKSSNRIGILKADGDVQATYEGDNYVLIQQVSKEVARLYAGISLPKCPSANIYNRCDESFLRSTNFQTQAYELCVQKLGAELSGRLEQEKRNGHDKFTAWNRCSVAAVELGKTHTEFLIFERFVEFERSISCPKIAHVIEKLRSLYCLWRFDNSPVLLRSGLFSPEKQLAIHNLTNKICQELIPYAKHLVDSFTLPSHILGEIAGDYIDANRYDKVDSF